MKNFFLITTCTEQHPITRYAAKLLNEERASCEKEAIVKNLAECIVVKMQKDQRGLRGRMRRFLSCFLNTTGKSPEIVRAEVLIRSLRRESYTALGLKM